MGGMMGWKEMGGMMGVERDGWDDGGGKGWVG